jgi:lipopolysaccharide export system protein LptA
MTDRATSSGSVPFVLGAVLCLAAWLGGDPGNRSLAPAAMAQGFSLSGGDSDVPIAIEAEQGIEWQREKQVYIARGNARASRGDVTVYADSLTAHYRSAPGGGTEIWRLEANGNVRITSPTETAYGDKGIYDADGGVLVLTGRIVRLKTPTEEITAHQSLEYWEEKRMAVARGEAVAVRADKRLRADVLVAHFREGEGGELEMYRLEAFRDVHISTPTEILRADYGNYDIESSIVTLTGSVKITRCNTQLNGEYAEMNLNTGVSKLLSGPGAEGGQPVQALFLPQDPSGVAAQGKPAGCEDQPAS